MKNLTKVTNYQEVSLLLFPQGLSVQCRLQDHREWCHSQENESNFIRDRFPCTDDVLMML